MSNKLVATFSAICLLTLCSLTFAESRRHQEPLRGHLEGTLTAQLSGPDLVSLRADGAGESTLGKTTGQIVWSPKVDVVRQLIAGTLQQASVGSGQITGQVADGSTFTSPFSGLLKRLPSGQISVESKFDISGGTGRFHNAIGKGELIAVADSKTRQFSADVVITFSRAERVNNWKEESKERSHGVEHGH